LLSIATTPLLDTGLSWSVYGRMLPDISYSKSGAIVPSLASSGDRVMIFGDSSLVAGLQRARQRGSLVQWSVEEKIFLPIRKDKFDSFLVVTIAVVRIVIV
jgi:hypothetical protein